MRLHRLFTDDRAVSPVIATVLLLALVILLGAVVSLFFLGAQQEPVDKPEVSFEYDYDREVIGDDQLTVIHDGGESLDTTRVYAAMNGTRNSLADLNASDPFEAGDTVTLNATTGGDYNSQMNGDTLRIVWENPSNKRSFVIGKYQVPSG